MERENEMIVISQLLKFESREEWLETRDKTRRHQTSDFYPPIFGHRPIYIRGEAATTPLNPEPRTLYLCYNNMNMFESKGGALWDQETC